MQIDLNKYSEFVKQVTSDESNHRQHFLNRLDQIEDVNVPLLLTAAIGLAAETGEFAEIPKKIFFQGKPLNDESLFHMKRELGDIMWYWISTCRALGLEPYSVIEENVNKLKSRYPEFEFSAHRSENRKDGDL